jgi:peptidoglycan-N-acetylglucosamine deacetylase
VTSRSILSTVLVALATTAWAQPSQAPTQPGTRWTEEQLKEAVAAVRVGRILTPKTWPDQARVAVCLSFDVDNESYLLARGEKSPTTLSAADFGAQTGLPRILELLDRLDLD